MVQNRYPFFITSSHLRVAYFPDTFYEINGVAHTSRNFAAFALRRNLPFFCVRPGKRDSPVYFHVEGEQSTLEVPRGSPFAFRLEEDLTFDPAFLRNRSLIAQRLREFRPDIIHITGPSEPGILGAWIARSLNIPLAASWHTNLHEYAAQRSNWLLRALPARRAAGAKKWIEDRTLWACARFYQQARILFAPNVDLCRLLEEVTGRECALMPRGVDTEQFSPRHRDRKSGDDALVLGYCGRLSVEKNVSLLVRIRQQLIERGHEKFRFLIVGHGKEEGALREQLPNAEFTGILRGEELARAYANMDVFVFPSHTDTFGNVVLEAMASGVPAIVTPHGGPRSIVADGETGFIVDDDDFAGAIERLVRNPGLYAHQRFAARIRAQAASWDSVFEGVYEGYNTVLNRHSS